MPDRDYFELRAAEEEQLAAAANDRRAAAAHAQMAESYRARAGQRGR